LTQKWVANAQVGKSDYERASVGTRGNDEDAAIVLKNSTAGFTTNIASLKMPSWQQTSVVMR